MTTDLVSGLAGPYRSLADLGVNTGAVGSAAGTTTNFQVDEAKFSAALAANPQAVYDLLNNPTAPAGQGVFARLRGYLTTGALPNGLVSCGRQLRDRARDRHRPPGQSPAGGDVDQKRKRLEAQFAAHGVARRPAAGAGTAHAAAARLRLGRAKAPPKEQSRMSVQAYQQYQRTQTETGVAGRAGGHDVQGRDQVPRVGAPEDLELRDLEAPNRQLLRAQEIILELMISVDVNVGPVARNLFDLYEFMHRHLVQANIRKDAQMVGEVEQLLRDLVPAWEQAIRTSRKVTPLPTASAYGAPPAQLRYATA